ncbi:hypothetical protein EVAR_43690_1 [Eumeta japonica]|uniref:Uncharacterized protein n=1 Tax=Eumeta variegata TaxID=151549 RepID=A0A4C1X0K9_EUMVA|nr:hypothetical protein EVAR_43690_1 [Eumeta japonica]
MTYLYRRAATHGHRVGCRAIIVARHGAAAGRHDAVRPRIPIQNTKLISEITSYDTTIPSIRRRRSSHSPFRLPDRKRQPAAPGYGRDRNKLLSSVMSTVRRVIPRARVPPARPRPPRSRRTDRRTSNARSAFCLPRESLAFPASTSLTETSISLGRPIEARMPPFKINLKVRFYVLRRRPA